MDPAAMEPTLKLVLVRVQWSLQPLGFNRRVTSCSSSWSLVGSGSGSRSGSGSGSGSESGSGSLWKGLISSGRKTSVQLIFIAKMMFWPARVSHPLESMKSNPWFPISPVFICGIECKQETWWREAPEWSWGPYAVQFTSLQEFIWYFAGEYGIVRPTGIALFRPQLCKNLNHFK